MDKMLMQYVFPEFNSQHGHMRTRVCKTIFRKGLLNYLMSLFSIYIIYLSILGLLGITLLC